MNITVHVINDRNMVYWGCPKNTMKEMDFERDYLPGVVAAEMGDCTDPEALKAQAVAARSFAYQYYLKNAAIYDTKRAQAFNASRAVSKRYLAHRKAVEDTNGIVVCYNGSVANTHYSGANGGYVRKSTNAWEPGGYPDPWDTTTKLPDNCHGSGMSQLGARNMARAGKNYREILSFYYPMTELKGEYGKAEVGSDTTQTEKAVGGLRPMQKVIAFEREQLNEIYDLGDHGPNSWDCSGLTMGAFKLIGIKLPHSSNYQWTEGIKTGGYSKAHGTIDTLPMDEDALLFNYGKLTSGDGYGMVHVATYASDKQSVIQAGGYGPKITLPNGTKKSIVSEQAFSMCKSHFSHWLTIRDDISEDAPEKPQEAQEPAFPTLRMEKPIVVREAVKTLQNLLNQHGANLEVDGRFGSRTKAAVKKYQKANSLKIDGVAGAQTWGKLTDDQQS